MCNKVLNVYKSAVYAPVVWLKAKWSVNECNCVCCDFIIAIVSTFLYRCAVCMCRYTTDYNTFIFLSTWK